MCRRLQAVAIMSQSVSPLPPLLIQQVKLLVTKNSVLGETNFGPEFRRMFHTGLEPGQLGHPSMNSLLCSLAIDKVITLASEDCKVVIRPSRKTMKETRGIMEGDIDLLELDTLASHSIASSRLCPPPADSVLRFVLPVQQIPARMREGESFAVVVTQVHSPAKFWFNLHKNGLFDLVKDTMDRMDKFYTGEMGELYKVGSTDQLREGNILAAKYQVEGFHRVLVIKVVDSSVVKLFFMDHGTVDNQKIKHCRFLHRQFVTLPGQAIQARLWGVKPVGGGRGWGQQNKARDKMVELVKTLEGALIGKIKAGVTRMEVMVKGEDELEEERGLALSLIDVLSGDGLDVGKQLVMEGLAEWEPWNMEKATTLVGEEGNICRVIKYQQPGRRLSSSVTAAVGMKTGYITKVSSDIIDPTPYLRLLRLQESNLRKLQDLQVGEVIDIDEDRETKARNLAKKREVMLFDQGLGQLIKIREERDKLELIWAVDKELEDLL